MSLEITLLRMLNKRERWERLRHVVPRTGLEDRVKQIAGRIDEFYATFPEVDRLDPDAFCTWYFGTVQTSSTPEQRTAWKELISRAAEEPDARIAAGMYDKLLQLGAAAKIGELILKYNDGADVDIMPAIRAQVEGYYIEHKKFVKVPEVSNNVLDLLAEEKDDRGIHWRLSFCNDIMRPMRPGDFIGIAARVDAGKTTFLTSETSFWAPQLEAYFGRARPVLWLNNEGPGRRIRLRSYQSALNLTMTEMIALHNKLGDAAFLSKYYDAIGGESMLRIVDIHKWRHHDVEDLIADVDPGLIVFDMIDNIRFAGDVLNGGQRTDQIYEAMYQWARDIAVVSNCITVATSQVSGDGHGLLYPQQNMLKDSKTGKQGAMEALIMIGKSADPAMDGIRGISAPKNKLRKEGSRGLSQCEVHFDGERARYKMPEGN